MEKKLIGLVFIALIGGLGGGYGSIRVLMKACLSSKHLLLNISANSLSSS